VSLLGTKIGRFGQFRAKWMQGRANLRGSGGTPTSQPLAESQTYWYPCSRWWGKILASLAALRARWTGCLWSIPRVALADSGNPWA